LGFKFRKKYVYLPYNSKTNLVSKLFLEYGYVRRIKLMKQSKNKILLYLRSSIYPFEWFLFVREGQLLHYKYKNLVHLSESQGFLLLSTSLGFHTLRVALKHKLGGYLLARFY
jgi:ribosomal protein S8